MNASGYSTSRSSGAGTKLTSAPTRPSPDLVIEVDISRSSLDRMNIYGVLGVPEVWRFDGQVLIFHARQADGSYLPVSHGLAFPLATAADIARFSRATRPAGRDQHRSPAREWEAGLRP